ncbi:MAG: helicase-associated domain-containing protein [Candidatus Thorarchaeota archaeon]|nr:helicase-associated domain-containing protein [Candidatus Thorarchaeota archaeon]
MVGEALETELQEMLREDLLAACQVWEVDMSTSQSGEKLTELLAKKMRDKTSRESVFATFSPNERDLLGLLSLSGGAMSYDRLKPYRRIYSYGQLNQTERDLRKKGIIVRRVVSRLTEYGREVAEFKIVDFFIPHLTTYFLRKPAPNPELPKKAKSIVDERDALIVDMLLLVSHLAKREIHMTSSWEFPKREIDHISATMSKPTEERFDLVQKLARKAGAYAIVQNDRAVPNNAEILFKGKRDQVSRRILLSTLGRTRAIWATPDQPTEYTLNLAICRLREAKIGEWVSVQEMVEWIRSELFAENEPLKWIQVDEERVAVALETPMLLGLVEGAFKGKTLLAVSLTQTGATVIAKEPPPAQQTQDTFFVQPNFEVSCYTSEMDYYKLYQLMLFSEPVKVDVVTILRITDKSVFQAIEAGLRGEDILGFLERESSKPVPANVARSIRDWTSQTTFATVENVTLFETETQEDLDDLLLLEVFSKHVVRRVGPTAVVVKSDIDQISEDLRKHKCNVRKVGVAPVETDLSAGAQIAEHTILYAETPALDVPESCLACPALQSCNRALRRKGRSRKASTE